MQSSQSLDIDTQCLTPGAHLLKKRAALRGDLAVWCIFVCSVMLCMVSSRAEDTETSRFRLLYCDSYVAAANPSPHPEKAIFRSTYGVLSRNSVEVVRRARSVRHRGYVTRLTSASWVLVRPLVWSDCRSTPLFGRLCCTITRGDTVVWLLLLVYTALLNRQDSSTSSQVNGVSPNPFGLHNKSHRLRGF